MASFIHKPEFEKLEGVFSAIKEIDRVLLNNTDDIFENVLTAIKDIDKKSLDKDIIKEKVIGGIRESLVKIYKDGFIQTNMNIGINTVFEKDTPITESNYIFKGAAENTSYITTDSSELKSYKELDEKATMDLINMDSEEANN